MSDRRIFRYEVPVDDQDHAVPMTGFLRLPLHVGCRQVDAVEFWASHYEPGTEHPRRFRVFGTGHTIPEGYEYVGTAVAPGGSLVWHLFENCNPPVVSRG